MATTTRLTFEEFQNLPEEEGKRYELDQGELLMTASPTVFHNRVRDRIFLGLREFVEGHDLGEVMLEMDFRLASQTVRRPDVAFVTKEHLQRIDIRRSPADGSPALVVEVISPANTALDTTKKTGQYLRSGCQSAWIVYPDIESIEIHSHLGVRKIEAPALLTDENVLPGFSMHLPVIFRARK